MSITRPRYPSTDGSFLRLAGAAGVSGALGYLLPSRLMEAMQFNYGGAKGIWIGVPILLGLIGAIATEPGRRTAQSLLLGGLLASLTAHLIVALQYRWLVLDPNLLGLQIGWMIPILWTSRSFAPEET